MVGNRLAYRRVELGGALFSAVENPHRILRLAAKEFCQAAKRLETTDKQGAIKGWIGAAQCRLDLGQRLLAKRRYESAQHNLELAKRLFDRAEKFDLAQKSNLLALCAELNLDPNTAVSKLALVLTIGNFQNEIRKNVSPENFLKVVTEAQNLQMRLEHLSEALSLAT